MSRIGSPEAQSQAAEMLVETPRRLYGLLAEDTGNEPAGEEPSTPAR